MILAFKVILFIIIIISFMGAVADSNKDVQNRMAAVCIASIIATFAAFMWL